MHEQVLPNPSSAVVYAATPSDDWAESFPLGNGRIGAMVHGQPVSEMVSLNHDLLWRNYLKHPTYHTHEDMPRIRELCLEGKWREAEELMSRTIPQTGGCIYINPFVPACDLYLEMKQQGKEISNYRRVLDMEHGVTYVQYTHEDVTYTRTYFCTEDPCVFVVHIHSSCPGTLSGELSLSRTLERECTVTGGSSMDEVYMEGTFEEGKQFAAVSRIVVENGRLTSGKSFYTPFDNNAAEKKFGLGYVFDRDEAVDPTRGASVCFDSCDEVTIVTAVAVDNEHDCPLTYCRERLDAYRPDQYADYLAAHQEHFASFYNRTVLSLAEETAFTIPLDEHVRRAEETKALTPSMAQLLYNVSRYVAIASGMPLSKTLPSKAPIHLQGIWNRDTRPAWESDYHTDLNIEMCYWPMGTAGLAEWYAPYLDWIERLMPQARQTARELYGCNGAAIVGCCDPFVMGRSDNVGASWLGSSAWLTEILWIYYEHAPNVDTLKRIYAIMQEFAVFYEEMMVETDGKLTFPFGSSPEMPLIIDGKMQWLSSPSSCDLTLVKEMYDNLVTAATLLNKTDDAAHYLSVSDRLVPPPVDADGCLMEWWEDHEVGDPGHRHRSPLITLCPGSLASLETAPELTRSMEKLLDKRIAAGTAMATSFSYVWDSHFLARLRRGDEAWKLLETLIRIHLLDNLMFTTNDHTGIKGGIKWFLGSKVIQVDAQLGLISSLSELVYQDTQSIIRLLPALPAVLPNGSMTGIRGRYGFVSDLCWENGALKQATITSTLGGTCRVMCGGKALQITCDGKPVSCTVDEQGIHSFETVKGATHTVTMK